jgi:uncharacterized membrane protein YraQ (UPF0718 family)
MFDASFFESLLHIIAETAPYLLFGFAAAGLLRALVPEEKVYRLLGENRFRSVFLASLFGVPLPLCSCSVIPAAVGLRQSGAGRAATTSFLVSTPETGVDSIAITYALMDPIMTVARPVAAFLTALVTGSAVGLLPADDGDAPVPAGTSSSTGLEQDCCSSPGCAAEASPQRPRAMQSVTDGLRYAFGPLLDDLALWLIIGFVLAATIASALPEGVISAIPSGWVSSLLMMLIATPVYICASAATPIAAALVVKGLDPGAALVFLLVGPATNVTTILVVFRLMGGRVLAVYIAGVAASALLFGMAINALYRGIGIDASATLAAAEPGDMSWLQAASSVALLLLLACRLWVRLSGPPAQRRESGASAV